MLNTRGLMPEQHPLSRSSESQEATDETTKTQEQALLNICDGLTIHTNGRRLDRMKLATVLS